MVNAIDPAPFFLAHFAMLLAINGLLRHIECVYFPRVDGISPIC